MKIQIECILLLVVMLLESSVYANNSTRYAARKLNVFSKKEDCTIIALDKIRGYLNWMQDWFQKAAATKCSKRVIIKEYISNKKSERTIADIILFHGPTHGMIKASLRQSFFTKDGSKPAYAMISMEQPKYAKILSNIKYINDKFDLLLTYSLSPVYPLSTVPNMPITYYPLNILSPNAVMHSPRPFSEKRGLGEEAVSVAAFVSNCKAAGASERTAYLKELMEHIPVHSYGKCFNNKKEPRYPYDKGWPEIAQRRATKVKLLSHYKFYLAFENSPVPDYVSEKVFEGLFSGAVPVYRGASSIASFMPSNSSFIDGNNLTPVELATKMKQLAQDEVEYNKFFSFKQQPLSQGFMDISLMSYNHPNVLCRLCDAAMAD
jgi:hypothetical protein